MLAAAVENARVVCGAGRGVARWDLAYDVVVARALAARPVVLEYAAPLLKVGGALVDWRGKRDALRRRIWPTGRRRSWACAGWRFAGSSVPGREDHHLHVFVKAEETPARFPRRAGVARKRPLGC